jgi:CsoR family transcriptional regulator, copper-sensing transcriptional repressor
MFKQNQRKAVTRLHIIQGQLKGLEKMVDENKYCIDIIRLSLAIQKSLQSFNKILLENHLHEHVAHQFLSGREKQAIKELSDIYFLNNK